MKETLYFTLTHFAAMGLLLGSLILWLQRSNGQRSRRLLAIVCFITSVLYFIRIAMCYAGAGAQVSGIMPVTSLLAGLLAIALYLVYPLEVIRPGIITFRNLLRLFSGYFVMLAVIYTMQMYGVEFIRLDSFSDILTHIGEPNVWVRLLALLTVMGYSIILLYIPHRGKVSNTDNHWILINAIGGQGISTLYALFILSGSEWWRTVHLIYFTVFYLWVIYQELYLRLFIASRTDGETADNTAGAASICPEPAQADGNFALKETRLWETLRDYMQIAEPWRNPDITLTKLAATQGTNRTTLSAEIRGHGFGRFQDFIAHYRVDAFCRMADRGEITDMNDAFFEVGFRSRSTAYTTFKKQTGVTPGQYIAKARL